MLIIFDYDGTLANTFEFNYRSIKKYLATQGIKKFIKRDFIWLGSKNPFIRFKEIGLNQKQIDELIFGLQQESIKKNVSTLRYAGVKDVVKKLSKQHTLLIITSNTGKVVEHFLRKNKLTRYITEILGAEKETSKVKKIIKAIKKYKVKKSDVICIADSLGDFIEFKQAGVKSIAVTWGFTPVQELKSSKADYLVSKPEQILICFRNTLLSVS